MQPSPFACWRRNQEPGREHTLALAPASELMESAVARRSMRRKRLARCVRPDLEFFFSRYEWRRPTMNRLDSGSRSDLYELESRTRLQDRR
jgi:hypothetical protein